MRLSAKLLVVTLATSLTSAGSASAVDRPVPARTYLLARYSNDAPRTAKLVSRPLPRGASFAVPAPGSSSDPTIHGGALLFFAIGVPGDWTAHDLRASRWRGLGEPAGTEGWEYVGRGSVGDPCRRVQIRPNRIKAICKTYRAVEMDLFDQPVATTPGVGFEVSLGADRYCAEASTATAAEFRRNEPRLLKAVRAIAPAVCPVVLEVNPTPTPAVTPTPTPPYGSASRAFLRRPESLLR